MSVNSRRVCAHIKDRRVRGQCGHIGCDELTGIAYRCAAHKREHAERMQAYRDARRERDAARVAA